MKTLLCFIGLFFIVSGIVALAFAIREDLRDYRERKQIRA